MSEETSKDLPPAAGSSSFHLIEPDALFREMRLGEGATFLDVACGRGLYTLAASAIVGARGVLYAVDLWEEGIRWLESEAAARGIGNLTAIVADVGREIPIADATVDIGLMATVLHDLVQSGKERRTLDEIARVMKPGGRLAILEFKKTEGPPGPPAAIRLTAGEVERIVAPHGFDDAQTVDVGAYTYLMTFKRR